MRNFILGILTIILFQGVMNYADYYAIDHDTAENQEVYDTVHNITFNAIEYLRLTPIVHVVTGRCRKGLFDPTRKVTTRQWFQCSGLQNSLSDLVHGE